LLDTVGAERLINLRFFLESLLNFVRQPFHLTDSSDNLSAMKQYEIFYPNWEKSIWTTKPLSTILFHESKCFRTVIFSNRIFSLNMIWVVFFERNLNLVLTIQLIPFQLTIFSVNPFFYWPVVLCQEKKVVLFFFPDPPPSPFSNFLISRFFFSLPLFLIASQKTRNRRF
jgi:hypothetical protein